MTARTRTALLTATSAVCLVALAPPAAAAAPTASDTTTAFTTVGAADGETFFYVDGFDHGAAGGGVVDVFGASVECSLPEDGTPAPFSTDGTSSAVLQGMLAVDCWDAAAQRGGSATLTVDLRWTATGPATRTRLASPRTGCTGWRWTAPAAVEGTVHLSAPSLGVEASAVPGERPAEIARTVSRCR